MKTLVIYFSKSGHTKAAAEKLAAMLGADTYEIRTKKTYPAGFLPTIAAGRKEFSSGERPVLIGEPADLTGYDRILLGFPVWYGTCPMAVISFLEQNNLQGKLLYPFCTSSMSGVEKGRSAIVKAAKGAVVRGGLRLKNPSREAIESWLQQ